MELSTSIAIIASGTSFLIALLTGIWKYQQMSTSENAQAHYYVDIAHRSSLMYSFALLLIAKFAQISMLEITIEVIAVSILTFYFFVAITTYIMLGIYKKIGNQLKKPLHVFGITPPDWIIRASWWGLIVGEVSSFLVLFYGVLCAIL